MDWGTVPAVISAIVAFWALIEARRARRHQNIGELQNQAKLIGVTPSRITDIDETTCLVEAQTTNYSEYPIRDVWLIVHSKLISEPVTVFVQQLPAKETLTLRQVCGKTPDPFPLDMADRLGVSTSFADMNGYKWQKLATGEILPPVSLRAHALLRPILRVPLLGKLFKRWRRRRNRPAIRESLPKASRE